MRKFKQHEIDDFRAYEKVRVRGRWNMLDRRSIRASGLSDAQYFFVIENYGELKVQGSGIRASQAPSDNGENKKTAPAVHE